MGYRGRQSAHNFWPRGHESGAANTEGQNGGVPGRFGTRWVWLQTEERTHSLLREYEEQEATVKEHDVFHVPVLLCTQKRARDTQTHWKRIRG